MPRPLYDANMQSCVVFVLGRIRKEGEDYVIWFIRKFHIMGYDVPVEKI
ncbi:hypothetical protein P5G61_22840 [Paenibacillus sp. F6_3S_P_1C]|uniref:Uncharacterized protein n=1 Tax=Paenibacillus vandeheii TaxID=3035917 RepID=A0ABT8JHR2_9BACL|nr:hypothetical protein [Paenibacillus vandeheii]MDN4604096.1 hypothetical protein [Paenibacillus vandeheii]